MKQLPIQPGEFKDVDALRVVTFRRFVRMMLPYKEPSADTITVDGYCSSSRTKIRVHC